MPACVVFGIAHEDRFEEKYRFHITVMEGTHDYLLRCSTDYYWYLGTINAVKIEANDIHITGMKILEGD